MIARAVVFVLCTVGSLAGITLSAGFFWFSLSALNNENITRIGFPNKLIGTIVFSLTCVVAWMFYSIISYQWIRYGAVNGVLKFWGFVFGSIPIFLTLGAGAVFTAPSVILMLYVLIFVDRPKEKVIFTEGRPTLPQELKRR